MLFVFYPKHEFGRSQVDHCPHLGHPGVSPTNNLAEQALRALVILRKLTFGSRTKAGAKRVGTMMTVIETAKRQGKSALRFLQSLFALSSNQAMRAMYARP